MVESREYEWLKVRKQPEFFFSKNVKISNPKLKLCFEKIVEGIQNETLYGFLIVDIHTPDELKEKFINFSLII